MALLLSGLAKHLRMREFSIEQLEVSVCVYVRASPLVGIGIKEGSGN